VVRYRVDGRLSFRDGTIPFALHAPLMSRIKVLASLNIAERRLPQDGRISLDLGQKGYDLRVATINAKFGEKVTLRILDSSALEQNLASLVLADKVSQVVRKLFYRPNGLVLVSGPTGSGKTTTLYAAIKERLNPELAICTIEDPIEYDVPGITQVQVNEAIGLGFTDVMRTFLRQDPDIILVGETRDAATAKLACSAALTGHLVLTSFHTNDTISAVMRLREMQIEPFVLAGALLGVINQRLVRRICPSCRVETQYSDVIRQNLDHAGVPLDKAAKLYKGAGCKACNGEGYKGRVGVFELLVVSNAVRDAIAQEANAAQLKQAAADGLFVSLARYAQFLLAEGLTVPSEILRILPRE
jgi:type II secretory ATPase GspE/PulE/Tfp pilus assembly ATPase PilB-like protein